VTRQSLRKVTGVVFTRTDLAAKQLGLCTRLVPNTAIIPVLGNAKPAGTR